MNILHRRYCNSEALADSLQRYISPLTLGDAELGDHPLEIGPGQGMSTDWS